MEFLMILGLIAVCGVVMGVLHKYAPGTAKKIEQARKEQKELERLRMLNKQTDAEMQVNMQRIRTNWNRVSDKDKRL